MTEKNGGRNNAEKLRRQKIRETAMALLRDARFLYRLGQKLEEFGVIGEKRNRLIVSLACVTRTLALAVSLLLKGASSAGKSNLVRSALQLVPRECVISVTSLSAKALAHGHESLKAKILYIAEYRGGKEAAYLTRLLQSEGEIAHQYAYVSGRSAGTITARRTGTPVVLTTTTDDSVFKDDENRFLSLRADESGELTREIIRNSFSSTTNGSRPDSADIEVWQEAIRILGEGGPGFEYPAWFQFVADLIPADEARARRDVQRFRSLLEAVALCLSYSDGRRERNKTVLEIDFADYCVAHRILNDAFSSTYRGTHPQAIEVANTVRRLNAKFGRAVTIDAIRAALQWERAVTYKWTKRAAQDGLVVYEPGTQPKNQKLLLPGPVRNLSFLPSPSQIFEARPELGDNVSYVDPLTGEVVTLSRKAKNNQRSVEINQEK